MSTLDTTILDLTDFTVEERKLLGYPAGVSDALLEIKMDEASQWIENETQQFFIQRAIEDEEHWLSRTETKLFLVRRPVVIDEEAEEPITIAVTSPSGNEFTSYSVEKGTGILHGTFCPGFNSSGFRAPWKVSYTAGLYTEKADVPPALKNACKLVLAWQWRVNQALENGDMVPRTIKAALDGFYSTGAVVF